MRRFVFTGRMPGGALMMAMGLRAVSNRGPKAVVDAPPKDVPDGAYGSFNACLTASQCKAIYTSINSELQAQQNGSGKGEEVNTFVERTTRVVSLGGRVVSVRDMGKVVFITIRSEGEQIQLGCSVEEMPDPSSSTTTTTTRPFCITKEELQQKVTSVVGVGDIIGATGILGRTKKGEVSVFVQSLSVLAPYVCTDMTVCPDQRQFNRSSESKAGGKHSTTPSTTAPAAAAVEENKPLSRNQLKKLQKKLAKEGKEVSPEDILKTLTATTTSVKTNEEAPVDAVTTASANPIGSGVSSSSSVSDPDLKYRYRFVDMLTNPTTIQTMKMRRKGLERSIWVPEGRVMIDVPMASKDI
jgi:lysyl-tRNA synthetase class II